MLNISFKVLFLKHSAKSQIYIYIYIYICTYRYITNKDLLHREFDSIFCQSVKECIYVYV